jgi:hypothetical protein
MLAKNNIQSASLVRLVYVSRAVHLFSEQDLDELLEQARSRNADSGVTGTLLYKDKSFIQLLEGESASVANIFDSIRRDLRHQRVKVLIDREDIVDRAFPNWSMGFPRLDEYPSLVNEEYYDFTKESIPHLSIEGEAEAAIKLLNYFRQNS